jgi:rhodanese-related sulfurtransferase
MTDALSYFSAKLTHETDASDVYAAQQAADPFVLVDVRGNAAWAQGRISGAIHMPHQRIAERAASELDPSVPVVVYCWSPGCNGGARGAREFAKLGFSVREMIGGYEYWVREGQPTETDDGPSERTFDAQVMVVRAPVTG